MMTKGIFAFDLEIFKASGKWSQTYTETFEVGFQQTKQGALTIYMPDVDEAIRAKFVNRSGYFVRTTHSLGYPILVIL